jgi:Tol biopolymer transport system component/DNA-binding winged helix-turn-helix (wHTH) protein
VAIPFPQTRQAYEFGPFRLDWHERLLTRDGTAVPVTPKGLEMLAVLVENAGRTVTKEEILDLVWPGIFVDEANIAVTVSALRKALGQTAESETYIETVPRRGYRFAAKVRLVAMPHSETSVRRPAPAPESEDRVAPPLGIDPVKEPANVTEPPGKGRPKVDLLWVWLACGGLGVGAITAAVLGVSQPIPQPRVLGYRQLTHDRTVKLAPSGESPIVTDGPRIYYTAINGSRTQLMEASASGGESTGLTTPTAESRIADISPDHTSLLLTEALNSLEQNLPLEILPLPTGSPRRLDPENIYDGTWSPDGKTIAYADRLNLMLTSTDGSSARCLATIPDAGPQWIRWSPDGLRLRFFLSDHVHRESTLWEIGADGTGLRKLLPGWSGADAACCGNWTPDGRYYVFQSTRGSAEDKPNIWALDDAPRLLDWRGREPVQLTNGPLRFHHPVSSLDGKRVFAIGEQPEGQLLRLEAARKSWVPFLAGLPAFAMDVSRDSSWICYSSYPDGALWRAKPDGSQRAQLTFPPLTARFPRWSPDGKTIAFIGSVNGSPWKVYSIPSAGGEARQVFQEQEEQGAPTWTSDGRSLVFARIPSGSNRIEVLELDLEKRALHSIPGSAGLWKARVSPDGRTIAALDVKAHTLMLFDVAGKRWSKTTSQAADDLTWSADSSSIFLASWSPDHPAVFRYGVSEHRLEELASLKDARRPEHDLPWLGLAPDGSPLVLNESGFQEVYALDMDWK